MKNAESLKGSKNESPKTPGGISKSLLTPCRRVGLSRKWKKAGPSPFVSPLSGSASPVEVKVEKKELRKRKSRVESEETEEPSQCTPETRNYDEEINETTPSSEANDLSSTPVRHVEVPRKKKSKILLSTLSNNSSIQKPELPIEEPSKVISVEPENEKRTKGISAFTKSEENVNVQSPLPTQSETVSIKKSKSKNKKPISPKTSPKLKSKDKTSGVNEIKENISDSTDKRLTDIENKEDSKPKSPKELTKECIVVIQKKIFKTDKKDLKNKEKDGIKSQILFDSDSDDIPIGQLNKQKVESPMVLAEKNAKKVPEFINLDDDDDDFIEKKKVKVMKLNKATSISGLKAKPAKNSKPKPQKPILATPQEMDFDDDDDFDFENKRTILIRKTYEKVNKPQRAKSTGSITQKDIDQLRAKIEVKKKLLLAKAMTEDTEELRSLIKKWQKGCQDALMELMELMKNKFPDKKDMDYSEMLSMLRIPASLVGYDDDNDCFNTPEDSNIILSKFNDL